MSFIKPEYRVMAAVTALYTFLFGLFFVFRKNYEFVMYIGVIIFFFLVILKSSKHVEYSPFAIWGLSLWGLLHLSGGGLPAGEGTLYQFMIIPLSETYGIFRYDQFVHIVGFFVATIVMWEVLKPHLSKEHRWVGVGIVVVMAGLGLGALNEIVEFFATVIMPETGVGGYINTSLDLVADIVGAVLAWIFICRKEKSVGAVE